MCVTVIFDTLKSIQNDGTKIQITRFQNYPQSNNTAVPCIQVRYHVTIIHANLIIKSYTSNTNKQAI